MFLFTNKSYKVDQISFDDFRTYHIVISVIVVDLDFKDFSFINSDILNYIMT